MLDLPAAAPLHSLLLPALLACSTPAAAPTPRAQEAGAQRPAGGDTVELAHPARHPYDAEFFPGSEHDPSITAPEQVLGVPVGTRPAHHAEVMELWRRWESESPRVHRIVYGHTYEGRELVAGLIGSAANIERLEALESDLARLGDPRRTDDAGPLISGLPAVAWLGYSIHGDETSGVDGGLALAWHLISGTGPDVTGLLDELLVVVDPMMNPDGRERILGMLEQTAGVVPSLDGDALQRGRWPWGRGNHYLFDMNRDWMAGVAPETRGRWSVLRRFPPQLFVDAHEMGSQDTFLFYPQSAPHNPHLPATLSKWHQVFGGDQARAFDRHGWSYYTREWADAWGPFYSDAWGSLSGAVGILYEQARYAGQPLRRASGEVVTYREAAHHQAVASLANLTTLAAHREEVLSDWHAHRRANLSPPEPWKGRALALVPGRHPTRERRLVRTLQAQGVEVQRATSEFEAGDCLSSLGAKEAKRSFPAGTWLVFVEQPLGSFVRAYLEFDPRMAPEDLAEERRDLERSGDSNIYDTTAWDLVRALGLDAHWCRPGAVSSAPLELIADSVAGVPGDPGQAYGWLVEGRDDASVAFAAQALELGLAVHLSDEPFTSAGRSFPRGSLLIRRIENGTDGYERVLQAAQRAGGVEVVPTGSARSPDEGPDLGGGHFQLLERPRVALLGNSPVATDRFGHVWHLLDRELGVEVSMLDAGSLSGHDLRRYNVLVLPPASGLGRLLAGVSDDLEAWVRSGGTLIAMDRSAAALADGDLGFGSVRLRRDVLDELDDWLFAARREAAAREVVIDEGLLWDGVPSEATAEGDDDDEAKDEPEGSGDPDAGRQDSWMRRFSPDGVFLRGRVDDEAWITVGCDDELPVAFSGSYVLLSRSPARTPVRLAPAPELRLGGLLWPEARERLADSAYLTVERVGHGQVILFASQPGFRGYHAGSARLLSNAVVYGPGAGTNPPLPR